MSPLDRRQWLARAVAGGAGVFGAGRTAPAQFKDPSPPAAAAEPAAPAAAPPAPLVLKDFQPRSMLHVAETKVERARFPVIDIHTHLGWRAKSSGGVSVGEEMRFLATPQ